MTTTLSQIELISAIGKHLEKHGYKELVPRQFAAVISAANTIMEAMRETPHMAYANMGLAKWLASDDTGMSSKFMAAVLGGIGGKYAYPHDSKDFGRCVRLLDAVPEFRERMEMLRTHGKQWGNLLDCWDKAENAYRDEDFQGCGNLVREAGLKSTFTAGFAKKQLDKKRFPMVGKIVTENTTIEFESSFPNSVRAHLAYRLIEWLGSDVGIDEAIANAKANISPKA